MILCKKGDDITPFEGKGCVKKLAYIPYGMYSPLPDSTGGCVWSDTVVQVQPSRIALGTSKIN